MKILPVGVELFHEERQTDGQTDGREDGQTDRHGEDNLFLQFCQHAYKKSDLRKSQTLLKKLVPEIKDIFILGKVMDHSTVALACQCGPQNNEM
jgi:hypothetical protein